MRLRLVLAALALSSLACGVTDVKDQTCSTDDAFQSEEGDIYCRDEAAPAECEQVVNEIIDAFVTCADGAFTEEELREALEDQRVTFDCDAAVATSTELDQCYDDLADPECEDGLAVLTEACEGSVLAEE